MCYIASLLSRLLARHATFPPPPPKNVCVGGYYVAYFPCRNILKQTQCPLFYFLLSPEIKKGFV